MSGLFFVQLVGCAIAITWFIIERTYGPIKALRLRSQSALARTIRTTAIVNMANIETETVIGLDED